VLVAVSKRAGVFKHLLFLPEIWVKTKDLNMFLDLPIIFGHGMRYARHYEMCPKKQVTEKADKDPMT